MFSFGSKPVKVLSRAGSAAAQHAPNAAANAFADSGPASEPPGDAAAAAALAALVERGWWMDSANDLQHGLEVVEMTDLPAGLFGPGSDKPRS
jgi:hypothetical protein